MRIAMTLALGAALLLLEAVFAQLLDLELWLPHIGVALGVYLALDKEFLEGAGEIVVLAWVADLLSGGAPGVRALGITVTFLLVRLLSLRLTLKARSLRAVLVVLAAAVSQGVEVGLLALLGREWRLLEALWYGGLPSSLGAPLGLLLVQGALGRVDQWLRPKARGLVLRE
jgi:cell shape-determining protein MreD